VAGLIVLINSCNHKPSVKLLTTQSLSFSSASAIEFYKDKLYIFGDDATYLLILSPEYKVLDTVHYLPKANGRLPKESKPDIESAMIMTKDGLPVLASVGSMSDTLRWNVIKLSLDSLSFTTIEFFKKGTSFPSIKEINIEGSCMVGNTIVFSNRANLKNQMNYLLFWNGKDAVTTKKMALPKDEKLPGISGLYYVKEKDLLLFTASEEATTNAIEDGEIGESYIGWITNFLQKMNAQQLSADGFLKLLDFDNAFSKEKIESLCVERVQGNNLLLHLVADNDDGQSRIFKVELRL